jgi:folate-binding protein YgfZ
MNKPALPGTLFSALPNHRVLAIEGRDALAFVQAQAMNDVALLGDGQWQWNGWLTPKGRVIALFALLRLDAETMWLLLPDVDPVELAAQLQRFVFRSKLRIAPRDDLQVAGAWTTPGEAAGNRLSGTREQGIELDFGTADTARTLRIAATADHLPDADADMDMDMDDRWKAFDLEHGLPRLPASQLDRWTPQQLSLDRLQAFSVKKGCYPGQEIVARTHFLGQAKRGLALFESDAALAAGVEIREGERASGSIVSSANVDSRHVALAVVAVDAPPATSADGVVLRALELRDGLAR